MTHVLTKFLTCLALFLAVGGLDYFTGYEVTSFPLYLAPILLAFFYFGKVGGFTAVVVATVAWFANDILTGHVYSSEIIRYWNAGARVLIYSLFVYGLSVYAKTVTENRKRLEDLRALIPVCHTCGNICGVDGVWRPISEAVQNLNVNLPECPGCRASAPEPPRTGD